MNTEKMKAAFADEAFLKGLLELETIAEVQSALQEKGVELSEDEILCIRELVVKLENGKISPEQLEQWAAQAENGELPEELLEQVNGGFAISTTIVACVVILGEAFKVLGIFVGMTAVSAGLAIGTIDAVQRRW